MAGRTPSLGKAQSRTDAPDGDPNQPEDPAQAGHAAAAALKDVTIVRHLLDDMHQAYRGRACPRRPG